MTTTTNPPHERRAADTDPYVEQAIAIARHAWQWWRDTSDCLFCDANNTDEREQAMRHLAYCPLASGWQPAEEMGERGQV